MISVEIIQMRISELNLFDINSLFAFDVFYFHFY